MKPGLISEVVGSFQIEGRLIEQYNVWQPQQVRAWYQQLSLSSQLGYTNTVQANQWILETYGLASQLVSINQAGVTLAREYFSQVYGAVGTCGEVLDPMEGIDHEQWLEAMRPQITALMAVGIDGWVITQCESPQEIQWWVDELQPTKLPIEVILPDGYQYDKPATQLMVEQRQQKTALPVIASAHQIIPVSDLSRKAIRKLRMDYFDRLDFLELLGSVDEQVDVVYLQLNCPMELETMLYLNQWMLYQPVIVSGDQSVVLQMAQHYVGVLGVVDAPATSIPILRQYGCCLITTEELG